MGNNAFNQISNLVQAGINTGNVEYIGDAMIEAADAFMFGEIDQVELDELREDVRDAGYEF